MALVCLLLVERVPLAADAQPGTASPGEGAIVKQIFSEKLPNVPGKTLTVVQVDYRPGGFSAPHRSHHIVSANASKTKPARLVAYVIADDSAKATVYDK